MTQNKEDHNRSGQLCHINNKCIFSLHTTYTFHKTFEICNSFSDRNTFNEEQALKASGRRRGRNAGVRAGLQGSEQWVHCINGMESLPTGHHLMIFYLSGCLRNIRFSEQIKRVKE